MTARTNIDPRRVRAFAAILAAMPGTVPEIVAKVGLHQSSVRRNIRALECDGKAHIKRHKRTAGQPLPVWAAGPADVVPEFIPLTNAAKYKSHRRRVKKAIQKAKTGAKDDGRYSHYVARHMARQVEKRTRKTPQSWLSPLLQVGPTC